LPLFAQDPKSLLREAIEHHQKGEVAQAIPLYEQFLQAVPGHVPARANLGAALAKLGRFQEAVEQYRKALEVDPSNFGTRLNLALALYKQAAIDEAAQELESLHKAAPNHQQVNILLADCHLQLGNNRRVIELLNPMDLTGEYDRAAAYLLGTALVRDKRIGEGQKVLDRILRDGESVEALVLLSSVQLAGSENKKAVANLARAIEINPNLPGIYSLYGQAKLNDGDSEGARAAFLKELERNPADYDANLQLGALYRLDKDYEKASTYLQKAFAMRPQSIAVRYQLGNLAMATGDNTKALELLEQVTREAPSFVEGHISLGTLYYRLKRKQDGDREQEIIRTLNAEVQQKELKKH
ncbi:MAG TPA: tetratricopeptide repeat protein, partial [Bryobacteraceae bacterium]|nr:tetratricopeptide repeat protein [Bryobacteraceae bacterium]